MYASIHTYVYQPYFIIFRLPDRTVGKFGSGKVWQGECLANLLFSSIWWKKVWQMNRSAKGLLIVMTALDGFSLTNYRRFAKLYTRQAFLLYGSAFLGVQQHRYIMVVLHYTLYPVECSGIRLTSSCQSGLCREPCCTS